MTQAQEVAAGGAAALPAGWLAAWVSARFGAGPRLRAVLIAAVAAIVLTSWSRLDAADAMWTCLLGWTLATLAVVDLAVLRLPDILTIPLAAAGCLQACLSGEALTPRLLGLGLGAGSLWLVAWAYDRIRGRQGLGMGDVKLLAAAGAWVGATALPQLVLVACALAGASLAALSLSKGADIWRAPFPFGAALAGATLLIWAWERLLGPMA